MSGRYVPERFAGATGELAVALQYHVPSFHMTDPAIRDMLQDIVPEAFSRLEMVGNLIVPHTSKVALTPLPDTLV